MTKNYLPLHQKYRPKKFDDLIGQEMISKTLKQALVSNKIAPAYLFCGPRGTGKTSSARIMARSLNCLESSECTINPCGNCEVCTSISNGNALDVIEIDAASNTGVDNIRDLIEKSRFAPVQARWKVYVIDECHMLSTAAFNALLKTLEEPPKKSVFILATTDPQRLLPTIISRCQKFDFRRIPLNSLENNIKNIADKEGIKITEGSIKLICARSQGGLRDAQRMLDQLSLLPQPIEIKSVWDLLGEVSEKELIVLASALINEDAMLVIKTSRDLIDNGNEPIAILEGLTSVLRDLIIKKLSPNDPELCSISSDIHSELEEVSLQADLNKLLQYQLHLKGTEQQLRQSYQPRLWLEVLLLGLICKSNNVEIQQNSVKVISNRAKRSLKEIKEEIEPNKKQNLTNMIEAKTDSKSQNEEDFNLEEIWSRIISKIDLPSTRMLLSQQANLKRLTKDSAEIIVASNWIGMIQSRKNILEEALMKDLGHPIKIIISAEKNLSLKKEIKNVQKSSPSDSNHRETKNNNIKNNAAQAQTNPIEKENELINTMPSNMNDTNSDEKRFADFFNGEVIDT